VRIQPEPGAPSGPTLLFPRMEVTNALARLFATPPLGADEASGCCPRSFAKRIGELIVCGGGDIVFRARSLAFLVVVVGDERDEQQSGVPTG
jgi:hypothetical protein